MGDRRKQRELKKAAKQVAELMAASLLQLPKPERERRLKAIHAIALTAGGRKSGTASKRSRTRESRPYIPASWSIRTKAGKLPN
jgi:hypothetical protein